VFRAEDEKIRSAPKRLIDLGVFDRHDGNYPPQPLPMMSGSIAPTTTMETIA
jgi:hypothetical protein